MLEEFPWTLSSMIWNELGHDRMINMLRMQEFTERIFLDKDYLDKIKSIDKDILLLDASCATMRKTRNMQKSNV